MKALMLVLLVFTGLTASAHVPSVVCKVIDGEGRQVSRAERIYPRRGDQGIMISKHLSVSVYWTWADSPMSLYVVQRPHAPWTFGEKILLRDRVKLPAGLVYPLDSISPGYRFVCSQLI